MDFEIDDMSLPDLLKYVKRRKNQITTEQLNSMLEGASEEQRGIFFGCVISEVNSLCSAVNERLQAFDKTIQESTVDGKELYDVTEANIRLWAGTRIMQAVLVSCIPVFEMAVKYSEEKDIERKDDERYH